MKLAKLFERMIGLGMLGDGDNISLPSSPKIVSIKGFPEFLDLENWEIEGIATGDDDKAVIGIWANGDWQEPVHINIFIYETKKPEIVPFDSLSAVASGDIIKVKEFLKKYKDWKNKSSSKKESLIREHGPSLVQAKARSEGYKYAEYTISDEDDIICDDDELYTEFTELGFSPDIQDNFNYFKKGYDDYVAHFLEIDNVE